MSNNKNIIEILRNASAKTAESASKILLPITLQTKASGTHQELFLEDNKGNSISICKMELPSNFKISPQITLNASGFNEVLNRCIDETFQNINSAIKSCSESDRTDNRQFIVHFGVSFVADSELIISEKKVIK